MPPIDPNDFRDLVEQELADEGAERALRALGRDTAGSASESIAEAFRPISISEQAIHTRRRLRQNHRRK